MNKNMDKIQFESRTEIRELMNVVDKYVKQNPVEKKNKILERFFDLGCYGYGVVKSNQKANSKL